MTTVSPLLTDFLSAARGEFSFLSSEFGYEEVSPLTSTKNEFAVKFAKGEISIVIEGINWGFGVSVLVSIGSEKAPLWAIAKALGHIAESPPSGQLAQLKATAQQLREVACDLLRGDVSTLTPALKVVACTATENAKTKEHRLP